MPKYLNVAEKLKTNLRKINIWIKIFCLFIFANFLFPFFINNENLKTYIFALAGVVIIITFFSRLILGKEDFKLLFSLWILGTLIYLLIAIPYIYTDKAISPFLKLDSLYDRWLYTLALPFRLLGIFSLGLIFISIISPIEFLRYGRIGYGIALLFRMIEHSIQTLNATKQSLLIQNKWPESQGGILSLKNSISIIKNSPELITTTIRNLIVWFPWAWLSFEKLKTNNEGEEI